MVKFMIMLDLLKKQSNEIKVAVGADILSFGKTDSSRRNGADVVLEQHNVLNSVDMADTCLFCYKERNTNVRCRKNYRCSNHYERSCFISYKRDNLY
jgi:hypothetical protein